MAAIISPSDVRQFIDLSSTDDDDLLSDLIDRIEAAIETYTGRKFNVSDDSTKYHDSSYNVEGKTLYLDGDLCAITSITNGDGTTIDSSDYVTNPRNAKPYYAITLLSSSGLSWEAKSNGDHENAITIVGKWGFSEVPPFDVTQAAVEWVAWAYRQRDNISNADRVTVTDEGTLLMPQTIPPMVRSKLNPYRKMI